MAPVRQTTAVRFSLRGVLIAVAVVAVYCAAISPQFRTWSSPEQVAFLKAFGIPLLGWIVSVGVFSILRLRAERCSGLVQLSLRNHRARGAIAMWIIAVTINVAMITRHAFYASDHVRLQAEFAAKGLGDVPTTPPWLRIVCGIVIGLLTVMVWWRGDRVDFCDRGVLNFVCFTSWRAIACEWILSDPCILRLWLRWHRIDVVVTPETWAEVNEILRHRYASLASPDEDIEDSETPA